MLRKIIYSDGVNSLPTKIMAVLFALMVSIIPGLLMLSIFLIVYYHLNIL